MHYLLTLALIALGPMQITQDTKQQDPASAPGQKAAQADQKKAMPPASQNPGKGAPGAPNTPPAPPDDVETEWDRQIKAAVDKVEAIPYVSAKIRQQTFVIDRRTVVNGEYKKGPNHRVKFVLSVKIPGGADSEKITACDGKTATMYNRVGDVEQLGSMKIDQIVALAQQKELNEAMEKGLKTGLVPSMNAAALLRGFVANFTFTGAEKGVLEGSRPVMRYDGHWRKSVLTQVNNGQVPADIENIGTTYFPQFIRVYLDEKTSWPLKVEIYRRDKIAEFKPQLILEFLEVSFPASLPDFDFVWTPPQFKKSDPKAKLEMQDQTQMLLSQLKKLKDKPNASGGGATEAIPDTTKKPAEKK